MNKSFIRVLKMSKIVARIILLIVSLFWFVFALLSGAEEAGGGIKGVLKNSMNALPWLILLGLNYLVHRWELIGGIVLMGFAFFSFFMFDLYTVEQLPVFFMIFVPLFLIASVFTGYGIAKIKLKDDF